VQVLLLEPERWRYLGLSQVLQSDSQIRFLGTEDALSIISLKGPSADLRPDVIILAHSLIAGFRLSILEQLRTLFPRTKLLVEGYEEALDGIAIILKAGAHGYFQLSSEPAKLLKALNVVMKGDLWAPRDAVALMAAESGSGEELVSPTEAAILHLLESGFSNKEIAQRLQIAPVTVKAHLTRLYRRFGVRTRLELLAYSVTHHLIPLSFPE
jgi:DNA-binding NarL/FixJ family response regulator